jgi:hypothetical protein
MPNGQKDGRLASRDSQAVEVLDDFAPLPESCWISAITRLIVLLRQYLPSIIRPVNEDGVILIHLGQGLQVELEAQASFLVNG